jgi:hypothetical protein
MAESGGANIEIAHHLNDSGAHKELESAVRREILEVLEAIVLALVAVATAWSGYQAALWDGQQYMLYGKASKLRIDAHGYRCAWQSSAIL